MITTYRLTEHHLSGVMSRYLPMLAEMFESHFAEISQELAKEIGIANGDKVTVSTPRGKIVAKAMVTHRLKPFQIDGKTGAPDRRAVALGVEGRRVAAGQQGRHHQRPLGHGGGPDGVHPGDEGLHVQRQEGGGVAMARTLAMFTDTSLCIGCRACQVACKQWNELPSEQPEWTGSYQNHATFTDKTYRLVRFIEKPQANGELSWLLMSDVCKHCAQAGCLDACPTGAIHRTEFGTVNINQDVCNGCRYCVSSCPFGVVSFNHDTGRANKCTFCNDRIHNGLGPACAKTCPDGVHPVRLP